MLAQRAEHRVAVRRAHLDDRAEFLGEERADRAILAAAARLLRPVLRVAVVGFVLLIERQHVDVQRHARVPGERHFADGRPQAAVRAVVVREQQVPRIQRLDRREETLQVFRIVDVGRRVADLLRDLRENAAAEAVLPAPEIDRDQHARADVRDAAQLRRQMAAHVLDGRERRDDQRHRRDHFLRDAVVVPLRLHRQRILADRNADAERRAQLHADRLDRVEELRVLALGAARGHPVRGQLQLVERGDRRGRDVRDRLAHRHAARRRRVDHRERRALGHRHRLAGEARVVERGNRAIGDGHLPRADHLVAHRRAAHRAVADRDEERLARDGRVPEHVARGVGKRDARHVHARALDVHALHVAVHPRRLAEQHLHRHVDRIRGRARRLAVDELEAALVGRDADDRERAALARADRLEARQIGGRNRQHVALLRLVRPDLARRQARFLERDLAQLEARTLARAVDDLGERIGQTARADVVNAENRVVLAELPAAVDHFLRAPLDFRVAALDRIEVELGGVRAGGHRARRAAAHADAHARAADLDEQRAGRHVVLVRVRVRDVADAARDHDRLVIAAHLAADVLLVHAEVAAQVRAPEFVVERGAAERAVDHDRQRRRDPVRAAVRRARLLRVARGRRLRGVARVFPRFARARQIQVRHREARQARLRPRAAARRAFVANLAARARRRAGERRDRARVIVRLHLHQRMRELGMPAIPLARLARLARAAREPPLRVRAAHDRRVVRIRDDRALRAHLLRIADHREQRHVLRLPVDRPLRVEDLVAAVFAVRLREHHQLDVGRVALELDERVDEVVDLVVGEREAEFGVRALERGSAFGEHVDRRERLGRQLVEQVPRVLARRDDAFRHPVVQRGRDRRARVGGERLLRADAQDARLQRHRELDAALDPAHARQAAVPRDVGRLARPRRDGAEARQHDEGLGRALLRGGLERRAVMHQRADARFVVGGERLVRVDEMQILAANRDDVAVDLLERVEQAGLTEIGKRRSTGKTREVSHGLD
ncbi:hypothetical protein BG17_3587 [Burkholderia pseudomallei MSHR491]|nr:hypothetical protein BG17_3587 [Burkholderia pseudomallei MSHR491]